MKTINKIISLIPILFWSCASDIPKTEDIAGQWDNSSGAIITLTREGTFECKGLPANLLWNDEFTRNVKLDGRGTWLLQKEQAFWEIKLSFKENSIRELSKGFGSHILVSGSGILENKAPWYLFMWTEEEGSARYKFSRKPGSS